MRKLTSLDELPHAHHDLHARTVLIGGASHDTKALRRQIVL
jgi:hypothetical protein